MGWGRIEERLPFSDSLMVAEGMELVSEETCAKAFSEPVSNILCAGQGVFGTCAVKRRHHLLLVLLTLFLKHGDMPAKLQMSVR